MATPRRPRLTLPDVPVHLLQRSNNRQCCFVADEDYRCYLDWLKQYADQVGCRIHAYVLMTNHVHPLVSAERGEAMSELMKALGQRYIELNPVRAGMVQHPADYRWSSYRTNAQGEDSSLITPHDVFLGLGLAAESREAAYRELFRTELEPDLIDQIRLATNGNFVLGSSHFAGEIAAALARRVTPGKSGRPHKLPEPSSGVLSN